MKVTLITEPTVQVIGHTVPTLRTVPFQDIHAEDAGTIEILPIFAGRACYQSFGEKAGRRTAAEYLAHIKDVGHLSVLEHSSVTFYLQGVSRSLTHELVRHRHLSYSQLSQRYVEVEQEITLVVPPAELPLNERTQVEWEYTGREAIKAYRELIGYMTNLRGVEGKQAREAARAVLPNCVETKIVVTGNLRAWLEVLKLRNHAAADAEIQRLARAIQAQLHVMAPHVFDDPQEA